MSLVSGSTGIIQPSTDRLTFIEEGHRFLLDGTTELQSVTTILKQCGVIDTGFYTESGAENGKRRHLITEMIDRGTIDWGNVAEEDLPYAQGWMAFKEDYSFEPIYIEQHAYSEVYLFAGIMDRIGLYKDYPAIVDIKTGSRLERWVELQLSMYAFMVNCEVRPKLLAVHLRPGSRGNYRVQEYGYDSLEVAQSILRLNAWKARG